MKAPRKLILIGLVVLAAAVIVGLILTIPKAEVPAKSSGQPAVEQQSAVDEQPLETAQRLASLAATPEEQKLAQDAVRMADDDVDLAFAAALRSAGDEPIPQTEAVHDAQARIRQTEAGIQANQDTIKQLTAQAAGVKPSDTDALREQIQLAQAELALDQDALADAKEDLLRAGGDPYGRIQRLWTEHEAAQHVKETSPGSSSQPQTIFSSGSLIAKWSGQSELRTMQAQLLEARDAAVRVATRLSQDHQALDQHVKEEEARKPASVRAAAGPNPGGPAGATRPRRGAAAALVVLQRLSRDEKNLAGLDKQIQDLQALSAAYGQWEGLLRARERASLHDILKSALWIILAGLVVFFGDRLIDRSFAQLTLERKQVATLRGVLRFAVEALGVLVILVVIFGSPNNMSTVVGLAGAGLTVALKDFVVSFFGWFVLMGRNGMRVGDWVEVNGVVGEVIEIGLLRTVLLETGNWTEPGHPTGRKVAFLNSFAVEGHYFNFTTSGQWLWDEIRLLIPWRLDPYPLIEKISDIVKKETERNVQIAEQDWQRVSRRYGVRPLSVAPVVNVGSTDEGVELIVRYVTRAAERYEVRSRLNHAAVKLIHGESASPPAPETTWARPGAGAGEAGPDHPDS